MQKKKKKEKKTLLENNNEIVEILHNLSALKTLNYYDTK